MRRSSRKYRRWSVEAPDRPTTRFLAVAAALLVASALAAAPAAATVTHLALGSFNGSDTPIGSFGSTLPSAAVDQSSGDVYVAEVTAHRVDKFTSKGAYAGLELTGSTTPSGSFSFSFNFNSGVAVDNSGGANKGDLYVADARHHVIDRFSPSGAYLCQINGAATASASECNGAGGSKTPGGSITPAALAVDSSGNLYAVDELHKVIDKFGPKGEYLSQIADSHLSEGTERLGAIAPKPGGGLYALVEGQAGAGGVLQFNTAGAFTSKFETDPFFSDRAVAVDPATGHVYVAEESDALARLAEYEPSGALLSTGSMPRRGFSTDLAVASATGTAYLAEYEAISKQAIVSIFGPATTIPTVTTLHATEVTETSATLNGHLDPDAAHGGGEVAECRFEYVEAAHYEPAAANPYAAGATSPCSPAPPYSSAADVSASLSTLNPDTTYHFRLVAASAKGSNQGGDLTQSDSFTIGTSGAGSGTVQCEVNNSGSFGPCASRYVNGTAITLEGIADSGSKFTEYTAGSGSVVGTGCILSPYCTFTIKADSSITANFDLNVAHALTVSVSGEGEVSADSGTITGCASAAGLTCTGSYPEGEVVTLTEKPAAGHVFTGWGTPQCDESTEPTCKITIGSADETVSAGFAPEPAPEFPLTIIPSGSGSGTVTSSPAGIDCGSGCAAEFPEGKAIALTAAAGAGSSFAGWSTIAGNPGTCTGTTSPCEVTIEAATELGATFASTVPSGPPLQVKIEAGEGTVVSNPAGIECTGAAPHECTTEGIAEGEHVTLTASPAPGYLLRGWRNCDSGGVDGRQCTIALTAGHKAVGAGFIPAHSLTVSKAGSGLGTVSTSPSGVTCGYTCGISSARYKEGALTLKEKPARHFHFVRWKGGAGSASGCTEQTGETCAIAAFDSDSEIEAEFAEDAKFTLSYSVEGGGQGAVTTKPTGLLCGYACTAASAEFYEEGAVEVSWKLDKGTTSLQWTTGAGTCAGTENALEGHCDVPAGTATLVAKFE